MPRSRLRRNLNNLLQRLRSRLSPIDLGRLDIQLNDAEVAEQLQYPHTNH